MSCKPKTGLSFILIVSVSFYPFQPCCSVSLGRRKDGSITHRVDTEPSDGWERTEREHRPLGLSRAVKQVTWSPALPKPLPGLPQPRTSSSSADNTHASAPAPGQTGTNFTLDSTWTRGEVRPQGQPSADPQDGYQADFAGFSNKRGKIWGLSRDSSPYSSDWEAMQPLVECSDDGMTLTVSGHGFTHLQVDRKSSSPISVFQLPSSCGYSVKASWRNLEMMVPYDGCYIHQEDDSYVLPLLWLGSPVKLSCPRKMSSVPTSFSLAAPSVFCSSYGMAVQIQGQEHSLPVLRTIMNGARGPFVSEMCAFQVDSQPQEFTFLVSHSAPCVTADDGLQLHLVLDNDRYLLSCPVIAQFPSSPPLPKFSFVSPGDLQSSYSPDTIKPSSSFFPSPKTSDQKQTVHQQNYSPYPGLRYHQLPQVSPPAPQPPHSRQFSIDNFPKSQLLEEYPSRSGKLSFSFDGHYPHSHYYFPRKGPSPQLFNSPDHPSKYPYGLYYPYLQFSPIFSTPEEKEIPKPRAGSFPKYYLQTSYHSITTATPVTQVPVTVPTPVFPPERPEGLPHQAKPLYPLLSYNQKPGLYPAPDLYAHLLFSPTVGTTDQSKHPSGQLDLQNYFYFQLPSQVPLTRKKPRKPVAPQGYHYLIPHLSLPVSPEFQPQPPFSLYPKNEPRSLLPLNPKILAYLPLPLFPRNLPHPTSPLDPKNLPHPTSPLDPKNLPHPTSPLDPKNLPHPTSPLDPKNLPHPTLPLDPKNLPHPTSPLDPKNLPHPTSPLDPKNLPHPTSPLDPKNLPHPISPLEPTSQLTKTKTPYTTSIFPDFPSSRTPHLQCLKDKMAVFLPFADPESLQVKDHMGTWQFVSSVSPGCRYKLRRLADYRLIVYSPLPACHSNLQTPTTFSLPIKYWDFSIRQNMTLNLQCPYRSSHETQKIPETQAPVDPHKPLTPRISTLLQTDVKTEVFCSSHQMKVILPPGPISEVVLTDGKGKTMNFLDVPKNCGYFASKNKDGEILLILHLQSHCHTSVQNERFFINVMYMTESGRKEAQFSCPVVTLRSEHECNLQSEYRLPCGSSSISQTECLSMGCCFNKHPPACYYHMDECTIDRHMIFSVPSSLTDPPLSPTRLVVANNSTCVPHRATADYALFKIPMDSCGTRRVVLGKTVIYILEVTNTMQKVRLNYGTITRDSPVRLLVECRYVPGTVLSVGYVVKTPTFGPEIHTRGVFGVQLRIAKDAQYSSYYPQYHQPLHMLLGKPLHLEVRLLNSPDPSLVLLVHFCVAYPRSGKAVWVLLYNGCPNALDPAPPETLLSDPKPPSRQSQTRRFTIRTFQFLPDGDFQDVNEEVYFMCSTEICSPLDGPCVEGCFGH